MKRTKPIGNAAVVLLTTGLLAAVISSCALATVVSADSLQLNKSRSILFSQSLDEKEIGTTLVDIEAPLVSPEDAHKNLDKVSGLKTQGFVAGLEGISATEAENTTEIEELARGLQYNPELIYKYVRNSIDYVPIHGSIKGATMTYLDGQGNDFDQVSLFIALMQASGYDANYVYGEVTYPVDEIASWLGVVGEEGPLAEALGSGGIPATIYLDISGNVTSVKVDHVWAIVDIGGTEYVFDPSFKQYNTSSKIDIGPILGYDKSSFLSMAEQGATIAPDFTENLSEGNITNALINYSTNLYSYQKTNLPNGSLEEVLGGRNIIPEQTMPLQTSLPYPNTVLYEWTEIPDNFRHHFRIEHEGIDHTFATHEIYGRRLSIFYESGYPKLRLDGDLIDTGYWCWSGYYYDITLTVDHPYAANGGTYGDQTYTRGILAGGQYIITSNFGGMTKNLIKTRNLILKENMISGYASDSEPVRGETLHIMGLTYLTECEKAEELAVKISDNVIVTHHIIGFVGQTDGPYIDIPMGFHSLTSINDDQELEDACFYAICGISSAFEHAMIMQLQNVEAVSTVRLIQLANEEGDKIFNASSSNWGSIKPQLQNYSSYQLDYIEDLLNYGCVITLPQNGGITLREWSGAGFIVRWSGGGIGHIIWGGLYGGNSAEPGEADPDTTTEETESTDASNDPSTEAVESDEPVNMASGAYTYTHTDLSLGRRGNPNGLIFTRYYDSSSRLDNSTLGFGWDHNYNILLTVNSDGYQGMGADSHFDAVGTVTELYVAIDLLRGDFSHEELVIATIAHKWFADQLIDNAVKLNLGGQVYEFIRLPDGTYNPPPGITDALAYDTGNSTYNLSRRFGVSLHFNSTGQIETWTDANANTMQFQYDDDGLLTSVTDAFGRSLTFNYNADKKLISVNDSAGRSVQFSYDGDENLTALTDPTGAAYQYSYDNRHRLTEIYAPSGQRLVTNAYDSFDRVKEQTNGCNYTYQFLWGNYRNVEVDPLGNEYVYYFDERARLVAEENKCGATTQYTYDGQNHRTSITDANGHTTEFTYDGDNNLISITTALGNTTTFAYDGENHLSAITDPAGNTRNFSYDTLHNLISITDPLGNTINYTYDSRGRITSYTDATGDSTAFAYDSADNLISATDALDGATNFTYDSVGNRISITDPGSTITSFTYDANRRVNSITDAQSNTMNYTYDVNGNLVSRTDGNGNITQYNYDENYNLITITYPAHTVQFGYDKLDNMIQVTDPAGNSTYNYDQEGRVISYMDKNGYTVNYSYGQVGNTLSVNYPNNKTVIYSYDAENRLESVTDWLGGQTNYSYDSRGLLTFTTLPNGAKVQYDYDDAGRMISLENVDSVDSTIASYTYTLDPDGNIGSETMNQPLLPTPSPISTNYTYGPDNRLISANGVNFQYDSNGNLIQKGNITYQYNYENRLVQVIAPSDTWEYIYDGLGNRIGMKHNGEEHWYLIDPRGVTQVLAEYDDGGITARYIYGLGLITMTDASDNPYYYHYNFIGSTVAMTNVTGNVMNKYAYTPFGELAGMQEAVPNPFRYVGEFGVMNDENGLLYMRARYYDPEVGRFITKDPIGFEERVNLYTYVGNNPNRFIDPSGLCVNKASAWREVGGRTLHAFGTGVSYGKLAAWGAVGIGGVLFFFPATAPAGVAILLKAVPVATVLTTVDVGIPGGPNIYQELGLQLQE